MHNILSNYIYNPKQTNSIDISIANVKQMSISISTRKKKHISIYIWKIPLW